MLERRSLEQRLFLLRKNYTPFYERRLSQLAKEHMGFGRFESGTVSFSFQQITIGRRGKDA